MSTVFLLANAFITKSLLYSIDYLFEGHIDSVILPKENYYTNIYTPASSSLNITAYDTITQSIQFSDMVLLCINENIPISKINYIQELCKQFDKKVITLKVNSSLETPLNRGSIGLDTSKCVVVNLIISRAAQPFCGELLLNQVMSDNNISFKQLFTKDTADLLKQLENNNVLSKHISKQLHSEKSNYDVVIISVELYSEEKNYTETINFINKLMPDYVIIQTDFRHNNIERINNYCGLNKNIYVDLIIQSHYIQVNNSIPNYIYCGGEIIKTDNVIDLDSLQGMKDLAINLFSKIALPEGVVKL